jgi:predicted ATP-grasp superfamily ATP-dependent carboligase
MKVGRYPLHYGSVAAARTLGRAGVPVFAVTEDAFTPTARSRYVSQRFVWPTTGAEEPEELIAGVLALGERIGVRSVLLPTDDEAAVLIAENADALRDRFLFPNVAAELPRRLASKHVLAELCAQANVPAALSVRPRSLVELFDVAAQIGFPLVLKSDAPWERLADRALSGTTVVRDSSELERIAAAWTAMPGIVVQEYLPHDQTVDWSVHIYCGEAAGSTLAFTGVVLRSFPAYAGVTVEGLTAANHELRELALEFCRAVGFRGIAGMNWRLDIRDGRYKLLDFNVRAGAKFRMFETKRGIDVVRALHLDLTGRPVPIGLEVQDRRYVVGNLALAAALAYRRDAGRIRVRRSPAGGVERAWLATDDVLPGLLTVIRSAPAIRRLGGPELSRGICVSSQPAVGVTAKTSPAIEPSEPDPLRPGGQIGSVDHDIPAGLVVSTPPPHAAASAVRR